MFKWAFSHLHSTFLQVSFPDLVGKKKKMQSDSEHFNINLYQSYYIIV